MTRRVPLLSRLKDGRVATLTSKNGLPCDWVHWVMEDKKTGSPMPQD